MVNKVEITLGGKTYECGYPNIGEYIEIEGLKQALTNGRYALISFGALKTGTIALDYLDACVYLATTNKEILGYFGVSSIRELSELPLNDKKAKELVTQYNEKYAPFFNSIEIRKDRVNIPQTIHEQEKIKSK